MGRFRAHAAWNDDDDDVSIVDNDMDDVYGCSSGGDGDDAMEDDCYYDDHVDEHNHHHHHQQQQQQQHNDVEMEDEEMTAMHESESRRAPLLGLSLLAERLGLRRSRSSDADAKGNRRLGDKENHSESAWRGGVDGNDDDNDGGSGSGGRRLLSAIVPFASGGRHGRDDEFYGANEGEEVGEEEVYYDHNYDGIGDDYGCVGEGSGGGIRGVVGGGMNHGAEVSYLGSIHFVGTRRRRRRRRNHGTAEEKHDHDAHTDDHDDHGDDEDSTDATHVYAVSETPRGNAATRIPQAVRSAFPSTKNVARYLSGGGKGQSSAPSPWCLDENSVQWRRRQRLRQQQWPRRRQQQLPDDSDDGWRASAAESMGENDNDCWPSSPSSSSASASLSHPSDNSTGNKRNAKSSATKNHGLFRTSVTWAAISILVGVSSKYVLSRAPPPPPPPPPPPRITPAFYLDDASTVPIPILDCTWTEYASRTLGVMASNARYVLNGIASNVYDDCVHYYHHILLHLSRRWKYHGLERESESEPCRISFLSPTTMAVEITESIMDEPDMDEDKDKFEYASASSYSLSSPPLSYTETYLLRYIVGQDEAIRIVARGLDRWAEMLHEADQHHDDNDDDYDNDEADGGGPYVIVLSGPEGVGKAETARLVAHMLFERCACKGKGKVLEMHGEEYEVPDEYNDVDDYEYDDDDDDNEIEEEGKDNHGNNVNGQPSDNGAEANIVSYDDGRDERNHNADASVSLSSEYGPTRIQRDRERFASEIVHHLHRHDGSGAVVILRQIDRIHPSIIGDLLEALKGDGDATANTAGSKISFSAFFAPNSGEDKRDIVHVSSRNVLFILTTEVGNKTILRAIGSFGDVSGRMSSLSAELQRSIKIELDGYFGPNYNVGQFINVLAPFTVLGRDELEEIARRKVEAINQSNAGVLWKRLVVSNDALRFLVGPEYVDYVQMRPMNTGAAAVAGAAPMRPFSERGAETIEDGVLMQLLIGRAMRHVSISGSRPDSVALFGVSSEYDKATLSWCPDDGIVNTDGIVGDCTLVWTEPLH